MIEISNLKKSFKDICVLHDINLRVENGEFCVLLGASGSGKSTILKILSSLESFDGGSIKFDNSEFKNQIPSSKDRQIIMQHYSLMPWLNAEDNIKFALKCSGIKDKNKLRNSHQETDSTPSEASPGFWEIEPVRSVGSKVLPCGE